MNFVPGSSTERVYLTLKQAGAPMSASAVRAVVPEFGHATVDRAVSRLLKSGMIAWDDYGPGGARLLYVPESPIPASEVTEPDRHKNPFVSAKVRHIEQVRTALGAPPECEWRDLVKRIETLAGAPSTPPGVGAPPAEKGWIRRRQKELADALGYSGAVTNTPTWETMLADVRAIKSMKPTTFQTVAEMRALVAEDDALLNDLKALDEKRAEIETRRRSLSEKIRQ